MNDDTIRRVFGQHLAMKAVIDALIATHPDPAKLLQALNFSAEVMRVGLLNSQAQELTSTVMEAELAVFLRAAEKRVQSQN